MDGEMIDWWTVPGERWGIEGLGFKVEIRRDLFAEGAVDLDSFSQTDLIAFAVDEWKLVTVEVVPVDGGSLEDMPEYRRTVEAVEWGRFTHSVVGRREVTDSPVRDMALDIVAAMRRDGRKIHTKAGSEFSPEKMAAPF